MGSNVGTPIYRGNLIPYMPTDRRVVAILERSRGIPDRPPNPFIQGTTSR